MYSLSLCITLCIVSLCDTERETIHHHPWDTHHHFSIKNLLSRVIQRERLYIILSLSLCHPPFISPSPSLYLSIIFPSFPSLFLSHFLSLSFHSSFLLSLASPFCISFLLSASSIFCRMQFPPLLFCFLHLLLPLSLTHLLSVYHFLFL